MRSTHPTTSFAGLPGARERTLGEHTGNDRAAQMLAYFEEARSAVPASREAA